MKKNITVETFENPRYDTDQPKTDGNYPYVYKVTKTLNVLEPHVGQFLTMQECRTQMGNNIDIHFVPSKK